jgi:DNA-binding transcriptional ArsR family regulator
LEQPGNSNVYLDPVRQQTRATVFSFFQVAVAPCWTRVRDQLEAERDVRARVAITKGVGGLLGTLHSNLHWRPPVLELPGHPDRDIRLAGRGLLLSPSLFLSDRACVVLGSEQLSGLPTLAFSVASETTAGLVASVAEEAQDERSLAALIGHTRAAALEALTESCTTGELSQRLGLSLAGASKHATVLRKAGLIATARNHNMALHSLTPLGVALVRGRRFGSKRLTRSDIEEHH